MGRLQNWVVENLPKDQGHTTLCPTQPVKIPDISSVDATHRRSRMLSATRIGEERYMSTLVTGGRGFVGRQLVDQLLAGRRQGRQLQPRLRGRHPRRPDRRPGRAVRYSAADRDAAQPQRRTHHSHRRAEPPRCVDRPAVDYLQSQRRGHTRRLRGGPRGRCAPDRELLVRVRAGQPPNPPPPSPKARHQPAPTTSYGVTKVAGELFGAVYNSLYGMEIVSLRVTEVYGPGLWMPSLLGDMIRAGLRGDEFHSRGGR